MVGQGSSVQRPHLRRLAHYHFTPVHCVFLLLLALWTHAQLEIQFDSPHVSVHWMPVLCAWSSVLSVSVPAALGVQLVSLGALVVILALARLLLESTKPRDVIDARLRSGGGIRSRRSRG